MQSIVVALIDSCIEQDSNNGELNVNLNERERSKQMANSKPKEWAAVLDNT